MKLIRRRLPMRCVETGVGPEELNEISRGTFFKPFATKEVEKQQFSPGNLERSNKIFSGHGVESRQIFEIKELETLAQDIPEICLVGKSNVGKSSLMYVSFKRDC